MEKKIVICLLIAFTALTGCSSDKNAAEPTASSAVALAESQASASPSEAPKSAAKKLSDSEAVALDYVNTFLNGSDLEAKKKFVTENVHPDAQPLFQMAQSVETTDDHKVKNPKVLESEDYTDEEGTKVEVVLIQGEEASNPTSELIVFINDKQVVYAMDSSDQESFNKVRSSFKEPIPESSLSASGATPNEMLSEIMNFVISDVWNDAFVDISWYIKSGTSSTGGSLDVDFTVEQLSKTMDKMKDYDSYIESLGSEYDSLKKVWTKLSPEIDRLYDLIQKNPPKANDQSANFDTGIFNQYMDAFKKEVEAVTK
ncbi:hypothetical protein [Paenibacillus donghaensis]|uniref:DUF5105 domain-containing protein n=1 Tax=Paenibacillus donghaensis TaxID=414771 RepID=A0A2Z2KTI7_9BACL|nr:hypothetical protein [Paenibacillus donghaensis]ASA25152.1 hypothetical protein B9T62_33120 [Paenibacillus donghaensis]